MAFFYHLLNHHISNIELQSYELQLQNHPTQLADTIFLIGIYK
jgi:hypothetical protein